jgi:hypothetical protein
MVGKQQGAAQGPAKGEDSSTAGDADAAAVLAVLRSLMGPDAMSLLPVLLVTSATAAAGLMLAASMSGVAGLVDKKRGRLLLLPLFASARPNIQACAHQHPSTAAASWRLHTYSFDLRLAAVSFCRNHPLWSAPKS